MSYYVSYRCTCSVLAVSDLVQCGEGIWVVDGYQWLYRGYSGFSITVEVFVNVLQKQEFRECTCIVFNVLV